MAQAKKKTTSEKDTITLEQIGSPIGRTANQRGTLIGLRLNKINRRSTLVNTPEVQGMIRTVKHLIKIIED